jgi:hypothetical protein
MLPYADLPGAVLSGNGASLTESLVSKTRPVNIAAVLPIVLLDPDANGQLLMSEFHPALTILQQWIDPADPLNFAQIAGARPEAGGQAHHIFQTYGMDDSYSPPRTMFSYAMAALASLAPHPSGVNPDEANSINGFAEAAAPISGNRAFEGAPVTVAMRQYNAASGSDGHFVVFDVSQANQDMVDFLVEIDAGGVPTVGD